MRISAVVGRGYLPALIVKDYALMRWTGAIPSAPAIIVFRSHARPGRPACFLVIDEIPAVGLYFRQDGLEKRTALCRQYVDELVRRDRNHPSVINVEPGHEPHSASPLARSFFEQLCRDAKALDPTRPVTVVSFLGAAEPAFEFCDVLCLNRYLAGIASPEPWMKACPCSRPNWTRCLCSSAAAHPDRVRRGCHPRPACPAT